MAHCLAFVYGFLGWLLTQSSCTILLFFTTFYQSKIISFCFIQTFHNNSIMASPLFPRFSRFSKIAILGVLLVTLVVVLNSFYVLHRDGTLNMDVSQQLSQVISNIPCLGPSKSENDENYENMYNNYKKMYEALQIDYENLKFQYDSMSGVSSIGVNGAERRIDSYYQDVVITNATYDAPYESTFVDARFKQAELTAKNLAQQIEKDLLENGMGRTDTVKFIYDVQDTDMYQAQELYDDKIAREKKEKEQKEKEQKEKEQKEKEQEEKEQKEKEQKEKELKEKEEETLEQDNESEVSDAM